MTDPKRSTGVFQRDSRSTWVSLSLDNPLLQGVLALGVLAGAVALLVPSLHGGRPLITAADIGDIAPVDVTIPRAFTYTEVDEEATREKREQAAAATLPIYDYHLDVKDGALARVQAAFQLLREALAPVRSQLVAPEPDKPKDGAEAPEPKPALPDKEVAERRRVLAEQEKAILAETRDRFFETLDEALSKEEYAALAAVDFSKEAEGSMSYLLTSTMSYKIVATTRQLEPILRARAITLRILRGGASIDEVTLSSFEDLATVQQASEKVAEKARQGLKGTDPDLRDVLVGIAARMVDTNTRHNELESQRRRERARQEVQELVTSTDYRAGQVLVDRGHKIGAKDVEIYQRAFLPAGTTDLAQVVVGLGVLLVLFAGVLYVFASRAIRKFAPDRRDVLFLGVWALSILALARVAVSVSAVAEMWTAVSVQSLAYGFFPAVAAAMLVRMVLNSETAVVFSIIMAVLLTFLFGEDVTYAAYVLITGSVGAGAVGHAKTRMEVLRAGVKAGAAGLVAVACFSLFGGRLLTAGAMADLAFAFVFGGVAAGGFVTAVVPVVESLFGYTTNIKLLELANLNSPLLRDLAIRAPGTFHHSIMLGTLVEAGAEAIRANPLLARVGAYYHDVGKAKAPEYFAENQRPGENPHDKLKPTMSTLILKDHIKDGVRILTEDSYPQAIIDICRQHSGTTTIEYFHAKASSQAEEAGRPAPEQTEFRYAGPKPQTREAALVFLADSIEAAAKSIPDPTHDRLKGMVHKIINKRFQDGQFEECDLTLRDLHEIAAAFTRVLTGIYHHRPQYPDQKKEEAVRAAGARVKGERAKRKNGKGGNGRREERVEPDRTEDDVGGRADGASAADDGEGGQEAGPEDAPEAGETRPGGAVSG